MLEGSCIDQLNGSAGLDTFVFQNGDNSNTIGDFALNEAIDLAQVSKITGFADLPVSHLSRVDGHVVIDDLAGTAIVLPDINSDALEQALSSDGLVM